MTRRFQGSLYHFWVLMFPAFVILWYFPVINFSVRVDTCAAGFFALAGSLYFSRRHRPLCIGLAILYAVAILSLLLPARASADRMELSTAYCRAMKSYTGTRYVWGGEGNSASIAPASCARAWRTP